MVSINIPLSLRMIKNPKNSRKCQLIGHFPRRRSPPPPVTALPPLFQTSIQIFSELTSWRVSTDRPSPPPPALHRNFTASPPSQASGGISVTPRGRRRRRSASTLWFRNFPTVLGPSSPIPSLASLIIPKLPPLLLRRRRPTAIVGAVATFRRNWSPPSISITAEKWFSAKSSRQRPSPDGSVARRFESICSILRM